MKKKKATKQNLKVNNPSQQQLSSLLEYYQNGRFNDAEKLAVSITNEFPKHQFAWKVLGAVLGATGRKSEAVDANQTAVALSPQDAAAHSNLGITLHELGRLDEAEASYTQAIALKPDSAEAHSNLGITLKELVKLNEAEASLRQAIVLKPDYAEAHNNLGVTLRELDRLDEAEASLRQAIALKPDHPLAHNNLGITLKELGRLDEAEASCRQAIALKPDDAEAHINLGLTLYELGRIKDSLNQFKRCIRLNPLSKDTWNNIYFPLQTSAFQGVSSDDYLKAILKSQTGPEVKIQVAFLKYKLSKSSMESKNHISACLSLIQQEQNRIIFNPKQKNNNLNSQPKLPESMFALLHFGRSGTGLLHSLVDGHPEISSLPSIYLSEFFDRSAWSNLIAGGWDEIVDRFISIYTVLFDSRDPTPVKSKGQRSISNIGYKEGMTNLGEYREDFLCVDKTLFHKLFTQYLSDREYIDINIFFKLVHVVYEECINSGNNKRNIFYHIHNPDTDAQLNFINSFAESNWVVMVRDPLQSCESWIRQGFSNNNYRGVVNRITTMLLDIDNIIFTDFRSVGVRLEDLIRAPKRTMLALCNWMGIDDNPSLYEMTAQGKKWWGDPTSPDYGKTGQTAFDQSSIKRKIGSIFSRNDQFIIETLFYPLRVQFAYIENDLSLFKSNLQKIRPMMEKMFDFEKIIAREKGVATNDFIQLGAYLFLRSVMIERWNILNKFHTYPNMLQPLKT